MSSLADQPERKRPPGLAEALAGGVVAVALGWAYWPTWMTLLEKWESDPQYSHGYLVPVFALYLLWRRRTASTFGAWHSSWWGIPILVGGLALGLAGTYFYVDWFCAFSFLVVLAGLCVLAGGWPAMTWAWPGIAFLIFMIPLPFTVEVALIHPLRRIATLASTYVLQTMGFAAHARGNVIHLPGAPPIGVAEACSGLSMLLIFFALCTAVLILVRRPPLEKAIIFLSAVPIALLSNVVRIVVTAILYKTTDRETADRFFHDLAGLFMMPVGLAFLLLELWLLSWVLVRVPLPELPHARPTAAPPAPDPSRPARRRRAKKLPTASGPAAPAPEIRH